VDRRTDIFSAGVVLWEMLTGKRLFTGDAPALIEAQVMSGEVTAPGKLVSGLSTQLDEIVLRAISVDPEQRFPDAHAMAAALAAVGPLANPLEVGAWVTQHVGEALRARAARILELESVALEELTLPLPASGPSHERPLAPIAFASSTVPTVRERPQIRRPRRLARIASAVTLSVAAAVLVFAQQHQDVKPALARAIAPSARITVAKSALSTSSSAQHERSASTPAATATVPSTVGSPAATHDRPSPAAANAPIAERVETKRKAPPVAVQDAPLVPAVEQPPSTPVTEAEAAPPPAPPQEVAPAVNTSCSPPYWVDKDGFKRFKLECVAPGTKP
jgi:serine/threonine-protein kinase